MTFSLPVSVLGNESYQFSILTADKTSCFSNEATCNFDFQMIFLKNKKG